MCFTRIIGDCHGKLGAYANIATGLHTKIYVPYSVQIGDLGFNYKFIRKHLDSSRHVFFHGNHDNFDILDNNPPPHYLGRYGFTTVGNLNFFFIGGGHSIDKKWRKIGVDWWEREELTFDEANMCIKEYQLIKPDIVLAHETTSIVTQLISDPFELIWAGYDESWTSYTAQLLQTLFEIHKPKLFIFGHHHKYYNMIYDNCRFICLPELGYIDIYNPEDLFPKNFKSSC